MKMMFSVAWHEGCYKNGLASCKRDEIDARCRLAAAMFAQERMAEYRAQIDRAIKEGRKAFDRDRFNVKRKKEAI